MTEERFNPETDQWEHVTGGYTHHDAFHVSWNQGPIALGLLCASKIPLIAKKVWGMD